MKKKERWHALYAELVEPAALALAQGRRALARGEARVARALEQKKKAKYSLDVVLSDMHAAQEREEDSSRAKMDAEDSLLDAEMALRRVVRRKEQLKSGIERQFEQFHEEIVGRQEAEERAIAAAEARREAVDRLAASEVERALALERNGAGRATLMAAKGVLDALYEYGSSRPVQAWGCASLEELTLSAKDAQAIVDGGGFDLILAALRQFPKDLRVQRAGIAAFANLLDHHFVSAVQVVAHRGLQAALLAMRRFVSDPRPEAERVGRQALRLVVGLIPYDSAPLDNRSEAMGEHGTVETVMTLMAGSDSRSVQLASCRAVLGAAQHGYHRRIATPEGLEALLTALRKLTLADAEDDRNAAAWVVSTLALLADAGPGLRLQHGMEQVRFHPQNDSWSAQVAADGARGSFGTEEAAIRAYRAFRGAAPPAPSLSAERTLACLAAHSQVVVAQVLRALDTYRGHDALAAMSFRLLHAMGAAQQLDEAGEAVIGVLVEPGLEPETLAEGLRCVRAVLRWSTAATVMAALVSQLQAKDRRDAGAAPPPPPPVSAPELQQRAVEAAARVLARHADVPAVAEWAGKLLVGASEAESNVRALVAHAESLARPLLDSAPDLWVLRVMVVLAGDERGRAALSGAAAQPCRALSEAEAAPAPADGVARGLQHTIRTLLGAQAQRRE